MLLTMLLTLQTLLAGQWSQAITSTTLFDVVPRIRFTRRVRFPLKSRPISIRTSFPDCSNDICRGCNSATTSKWSQKCSWISSGKSPRFVILQILSEFVAKVASCIHKCRRSFDFWDISVNISLALPNYI